MKHSKAIAVAALAMLCVATGVFAEQPPIKSGGWYWDPPVNLKGKWFSSVDESYKEQDGYAIVQGRKLHYWLYDTYTYHAGYGRDILDKYVPKWIESMGYVIDFDNIKRYDPNTGLANSVKVLMKQRGCDVSVTLITDVKPHYVIINNYDIEKDVYWSIAYVLYK